MLIGAMLIALALIVLALVGTSAKQADAATTIVTKTFDKPAQITIPAGADVAGGCLSGPTAGSAAPYPSEKSVSAFPAGSHIRDVNLTLRNFTHHDDPNDVDVLLAHRGVNRTVMSDVSANNDDVNNITLVLDDEAATSLPASPPLVAGAFKPTNFGLTDTFPFPAPTQNSASRLSGFDTLNPNGLWRFFVQDDAGFDCGAFLGGWSIKVRAAVPA